MKLFDGLIYRPNAWPAHGTGTGKRDVALFCQKNKKKKEQTELLVYTKQTRVIVWYVDDTDRIAANPCDQC